MKPLETIGNPETVKTCTKTRSPAPRTAPDLHQNSESTDTSTGATIVPLPVAPVNKESTALTEFDREWFTYRGREWRIFKRGDGPKAKWYIYFEHHKKRYQQSLGEVNKAAAIESAKIKINAVLDGHKETLRASMHRDPEAKPEACTVGELIKSYEAATLDMSADTQHRNVVCFRLVLRKALGLETEPDNLSSAVLTAETAERYFEATLKAAKAAGSQEEQARVKRSANSIFNQGKCLLRPKALAIYKRAGLQLPDLAGFSAAYKAEKFSVGENEYNPPADSVIRRALHDWVRLKDRNMVLAVGLALACGLRKNEIQQVTWGMFSRSHEGELLDGRGHVKNQTARFVVPPIDPFWTVLLRRIKRENWRGEADQLLLTGNATETTDLLWRRIADWLDNHEWKTEKKAHALRAYSGSLVAMKYGIWRASAWLRHASVNTTQNFYMHFLNERVFRPENVKIKWARSRIGM